MAKDAMRKFCVELNSTARILAAVAAGAFALPPEVRAAGRS